MAYEKVKAWLDENKAKLVRYSDNELLFRRELVRVWPAEIDAIVEDALLYLYTYGSASNSSAQQWVDDPKAERLTYAGRWRVVRNEKTSMSNEKQWSGMSGIVQTLRHGLAQTIDWTEARIVTSERHPGNTSEISGISDTISDNPEDFMTVEFVNLNPDYMRQMISGLVSDSVVSLTDPVIQGVSTYTTGTWHVIGVTASESVLEDGSGRIQVVLARPQYTLNAYDSYLTLFNGSIRHEDTTYLWNVPKDKAQSILDDFKGNGRSARAFYTGDNLVNLILGAFDYGDGMYLYDFVSAGACSYTETQQFYWGVEDPSGAAYQISTLPNYGSPGYTYSRNLSFNRSEGLFDIVITEVKKIARNIYLTNVHQDGLSTEDEIQQLAIGGISEIVSTSPGQGEMYDKRVNVLDDCSVNAFTRYITSTPRDYEFKTMRSPLSLDVEHQYRNNLTLIEPPSTVSSGQYETQNRLNPDLTYDSVLRYLGPIAASAQFRSSRTAFRIGNAILYRNWPEPISAPENWTGTGAYSVSQTLVEGGVYDGLLVYESGDANAYHFFKNLESRLEESWEWMYRDSPVPIAIPSEVDTQLYRVDQSLDSQGLYQGSLFYNTGVEHTTSFYSRRGYMHSREDFNFSNLLTQPETPAFAQGELFSLDSRVNRYGLYDGQYTTTYSEERSLYDSWPDRGGTSYRYFYWNQREWPAALIDSLPSNRNNDIQLLSFNEDQTYDIRITSSPGRQTAFGNLESFYYWEYTVLRAGGGTVSEDSPRREASFVLNGMYHRVSYEVGEENAFETAQEGWNASIRDVGSHFRVDRVLTIVDQDASTPATTGLGPATPGWPA